MAYRVYEIPLVAPGFSPEEFSRPASAEARATAEMYRRAGELFIPMAKREDTTEEETKEENLARRKAWIDANRKVIEMAMEASRRPECDALEPRGGKQLGDAGHRLAWLLLGEAGLLDAVGDLDAGLERGLGALRISSHVRPRSRDPIDADMIESSVHGYLDEWAAEPGQTPERIRIAIEAIERLMAEPPSQTDAIKADYVITRRIVEGDIDLLGNVLSKSDVITRTRAVRAVVAMQWMPWEKARAVRLLDCLTAAELKQIESVERAVADGLALPMANHYDVYDRKLYVLPHLAGLHKTTTALRHLYYPNWYGQARMAVDVSTRRRAACLVLALVAWKLEHGELPDELDDLIGPYLTKLPPDPHTGEPFRYFPQGIPIAITDPYASDADDGEPIELVGAEQPFIWSTGRRVSVNRSNSGRVLDKYNINEHYNSYRSPQSEYEIWRRGECFTIP